MNSKTEGVSAPVSVVVIGVEDMDVSLGFYVDILGLDVAETRTWQGDDFEHYWRLALKTKAGRPKVAETLEEFRWQFRLQVSSQPSLLAVEVDQGGAPAPASPPCAPIP